MILVWKKGSQVCSVHAEGTVSPVCPSSSMHFLLLFSSSAFLQLEMDLPHLSNGDGVCMKREPHFTTDSIVTVITIYVTVKICMMLSLLGPVVIKCILAS